MDKFTKRVNKIHHLEFAKFIVERVVLVAVVMLILKLTGVI